jgi:hypothetical protein
MCTFDKKNLNDKVVVGYKLAIKDKYNHYYSPVTGMRYKVGKVKAATEYGKHNVRKDLLFNNILNKSAEGYNPNYSGMTSVFESYQNAIIFKEYCLQDIHNCNMSALNKNLVILQMELSGDLYNGTYGPWCIFAGSEIKSISLIKKVKE